MNVNLQLTNQTLIIQNKTKKKKKTQFVFVVVSKTNCEIKAKIENVKR